MFYFFSFVAVAAAAAAAEAGVKPNLLLILADDLGSNDLGYVNEANARDTRTPNIDRLSSQGVRHIYHLPQLPQLPHRRSTEPLLDLC